MDDYHKFEKEVQSLVSSDVLTGLNVRMLFRIDPTICMNMRQTL